MSLAESTFRYMPSLHETPPYDFAPDSHRHVFHKSKTVHLPGNIQYCQAGDNSEQPQDAQKNDSGSEHEVRAYTSRSQNDVPEDSRIRVRPSGSCVSTDLSDPHHFAKSAGRDAGFQPEKEDLGSITPTTQIGLVVDGCL